MSKFTKLINISFFQQIKYRITCTFCKTIAKRNIKWKYIHMIACQ